MTGVAMAGNIKNHFFIFDAMPQLTTIFLRSQLFNYSHIFNIVIFVLFLTTALRNG